MEKANTGKFVISIIACYAAGFIGSIFTRAAIPTWYQTLEKPSFNPPDWVFFPVWTTLYALMGISAFLVWRRGFKEKGVPTALAVFAIQLILNALWSVVFFGFRSPVSGMAVIAFLWVSILLSSVWFFRISAVAGLLLLPYLCWAGFAAILNLSIWLLN